MNYNLAFWLYAYVLMMVVVYVAFKGVGHIKRGEQEAHMKKMVFACNILIFFVVSYVVKILVLGREDKVGWQTMDLVVLYVHETCIFIMLLAGTYARIQAARFKDRPVSEIPAAARKKHARSGKVAITAATLALFTASFVLYGMWRRG